MEFHSLTGSCYQEPARSISTAGAMQSARTEFLDCCRRAVRSGTFVKLTLGGCTGLDASLKKVLVRTIALRAGPRLSFVYRHATRDITKNFTHEEGIARIEALLREGFQTANLFTTEQSTRLEFRDSHEPRLVIGKTGQVATPDGKHDRTKKRLIDSRSPWLHALGVATAEGRVAKGMEAKFRQINRFVEILQPLLNEAGLDETGDLTLVDMGCGKGYLTFAAYDFLVRNGRGNANVRGIEARRELVELCSRVAAENRFGGLHFEAGTIESAPLDGTDVLIALHACDTATDDAIAKGIQAGASLILVAPCCHKELRPQLRPPPALSGAFKHGILRERQAEFITDALRAALLEWAGYDAKVFEFISTEHTAKNLMIAGVKREHPKDREELAQRVRGLAEFYGVQTHRLAEQLGLSLIQPQMNADERR